MPGDLSQLDPVALILVSTYLALKTCLKPSSCNPDPQSMDSSTASCRGDPWCQAQTSGRRRTPHQEAGLLLLYCASISGKAHGCRRPPSTLLSLSRVMAVRRRMRTARDGQPEMTHRHLRAKAVVVHREVILRCQFAKTGPIHRRPGIAVRPLPDPPPRLPSGS
jgi:hypothetical protein